jgi:3-deoxy-7-phosphoheptulonate synthase
MVVKMKRDASEQEVDKVCQELKKYGIKPDIMSGDEFNIVGMVGDEGNVDVDHIRSLSGVSDVVLMQSEVPYKLVSRKYHPSDVIVQIGDVKVGGDRPVYFTGSCSVENEEQFYSLVDKLMEKIIMKDPYGQYVIRGGAWKFRGKAGTWQGLGEKALVILDGIRHKFGLPVVTEVPDTTYVNVCAEHVDVLQIGTVNMGNQYILMEVGKTGKPVLYKRNYGAHIEDWLQRACHIVSAGDGKEANKNIIFCERGMNQIGSGERFTRYPIDMSAIPVIKDKTYFPVIADVSHSAGRSDFIPDYALSAIGMGAHGLMIETHENPEVALTDGPQMVTPDELYVIIQSCNELHAKRHEYRPAWEKVSRTGNDLHVAYI